MCSEPRCYLAFMATPPPGQLVEHANSPHPFCSLPALWLGQPKWGQPAKVQGGGFTDCNELTMPASRCNRVDVQSTAVTTPLIMCGRLAFEAAPCPLHVALKGPEVACILLLSHSLRGSGDSKQSVVFVVL